jgi:hypothetical protein
MEDLAVSTALVTGGGRAASEPESARDTRGRIGRATA